MSWGVAKVVVGCTGNLKGSFDCPQQTAMPDVECDKAELRSLGS